MNAVDWCVDCGDWPAPPYGEPCHPCFLRVQQKLAEGRARQRRYWRRQMELNWEDDRLSVEWVTRGG